MSNSERARQAVTGTVPRWATTILLAVAVWFSKRYVDHLDTILEMHEHRLQTIEVWKAGLDARQKNDRQN